MSYDAKQSLVSDRQLKVQRLVVPFQVVGSATAADVALSNDEPSLVFLQSEGVDQITAALATDETATFTDATPTDSSGQLNVLIRIGEEVEKVCGAEILNLDADAFTAVSGMAANLGSSTGITTGDAGGKSIMLSLDTGDSHATGTHKRCLVVEYIVAQ